MRIRSRTQKLAGAADHQRADAPTDRNIVLFRVCGRANLYKSRDGELNGILFADLSGLVRWREGTDRAKPLAKAAEAALERWHVIAGRRNVQINSPMPEADTELASSQWPGASMVIAERRFRPTRGCFLRSAS
jgi:hypothetical protein